MYMLLRVLPCRARLLPRHAAKDREDRYQRLRAGMEQFIRANGKNDPEAMISGIDENIKRALQALNPASRTIFRSRARRWTN